MEWRLNGAQPKEPKAPRQAKNNSKSMLASFCRIDWIVCGGVVGCVVFFGWIMGWWASQCSAQGRQAQQQPTQQSINEAKLNEKEI